MQVSFEGICLWDTRSPQRLLGIMPNASQGENVAGVAIPAHTACIIVREDAVDDTQWDEEPETVQFRGVPHSLYRLLGDEISIEPPPAGGSPNLALLSRQFRCPMDGRELDPALTGNAPSAAGVAARIDIPRTANLIGVRNTLGAVSTILATANGTIVARRFDGSVRRLSFLGNNPRVKIANVDLELAFADPATAIDDNHSGLYCRMFVASAAETTPLPPRRGDLIGGLLFPLDVGDVPRRRDSIEATDRQRRPVDPQRPRRRLGEFLTLGAGCSNSQYP